MFFSYAVPKLNRHRNVVLYFPLLWNYDSSSSWICTAKRLSTFVLLMRSVCIILILKGQSVMPKVSSLKILPWNLFLRLQRTIQLVEKYVCLIVQFVLETLQFVKLHQKMIFAFWTLGQISACFYFSHAKDSFIHIPFVKNAWDGHTTKNYFVRKHSHHLTFWKVALLSQMHACINYTRDKIWSFSCAFKRA